MAMPRILVVEDERIVALNLKQMLLKLGYDVVDVVSTGEKALAAVERTDLDLVLMDIHIDGPIDGVETAARLPDDRHVPVIYLTAYSEEATLERARETEPYGYLLKPFSEREVHAAIQMALARRRSDIEVTESQERLNRLFDKSREELEKSRASEKRAVEASQLLAAVLDAVPIPLMVSNLEGVLITWNSAATVAFGYTAPEMIGRDPEPLFPQETRPLAAKLRGDALAGRPVDGLEVACLHKDGERRLVNLFMSPARGADSKVRALIIAMDDVTQQKSIEAQLRQAQKMEAIGQLTGGIAHDFNNLLAILSGNLELIEEVAPPDGSIAGMVKSALEACQRGANLTHRLLAYSRSQPLEPSTVDLAGLVRDAEALFRQSLEKNVRIDVRLEDHLWKVRIDAAQLQDALLNLALNARDAMMPVGGRLTIEAANTSLDEYYAEHNLEVMPGDYVLVAVSDTGVGIPPELLERATEPFFTTKAVGKGTGLGLSMVFGFVKQSGGHMKIYSEPGIGTTIKLYLPRADRIEAARPDLGAADDTPTAQPGETVLVVEDDGVIRKIALTFLTGLGYAVIEAEDGKAALDVLRGAARVDLLFTDVVLSSGMSGPEIVSRARTIRPGIKALYMSGYTSQSVISDIDNMQLLSKPFLRKDLARRVRYVLDVDAP
jgi:PAS domain S-box-containing protein